VKYPRGRIVLFARTPQVGRVKTRLAAGIGPEAAFDLYCALLEDSVRKATQAGVADVSLYVYPAVDSTFCRDLSDRYLLKVCQQHGRNLGERMTNAIGEQLREAEFVVLAGSDCPLIDKAYLEQAADRLAGGTSLLFGPADDGGYVMVGMSRLRKGVFENVAWGTAAVMAQTRNQCRLLGLKFEELPPLFDIDTLSDWERLQRHHPDIADRLHNLNREPAYGTQIAR
jgi:rSAM/selenodomain-associated transferase 1